MRERKNLQQRGETLQLTALTDAVLLNKIDLSINNIE